MHHPLLKQNAFYNYSICNSTRNIKNYFIYFLNILYTKNIFHASIIDNMKEKLLPIYRHHFKSFPFITFFFSSAATYFLYRFFIIFFLFHRFHIIIMLWFRICNWRDIAAFRQRCFFCKLIVFIILRIAYF